MTTEVKVNIEQETTDALANAPAFQKIESAEDASRVGDFLTVVRSVRKKITEFFRDDIDKAHALHKSLLAKMKQVDERPAKAEEVCRRMLGDWQDRENARIREEQRKLDEQAKAQAIADAKKEGDKKLAAQIERGTVAVASSVVAAPVAKVEGVSTRDDWKAEVVDKLTFIKAVATGTQPLDWLEIEIGAISKVMQATKGQMQIPGIRAVRKTVVIHRNA